jgi:hypothetical protein
MVGTPHGPKSGSQSILLGRQECANVRAFAVGLILTIAQKSSVEFVKYFRGFRTKVLENVDWGFLLYSDQLVAVS